MTANQNGDEHLCITSIVFGRKQIIEELPSYKSGLYTFINPVEAHMTMSQNLSHPEYFLTSQDRLGHPVSTMMRKL